MASIQRNLFNVIIERDSQIAIQVITNAIKPPNLIANIYNRYCGADFCN